MVRGKARGKWERGRGSDDVLTKCFVRYVNIANVYKNMQKKGCTEDSERFIRQLKRRLSKGYMNCETITHLTGRSRRGRTHKVYIFWYNMKRE